MSPPTYSSWQGEPALRWERGGTTVLVVPRRGGKIASITAADREWLGQPALPIVGPARPGDEFIASDMCGWDECAPTIDRCTVGGIDLAGHGDLWNQPWTFRGGSLTAVGRTLEFRLERRLELRPDGGVVVHYRVRALRTATPILWAAHPQFSAPTGARVRIPSSPGATVIRTADGTRSPMNTALTIDSLARGESHKFVSPAKTPVDDVELVVPGSATLRMSWDGGAVPYCGYWLDRTGFSPNDVIAIEPMTSWYDSLENAIECGRALIVEPRRPLEWELLLAFV